MLDQAAKLSDAEYVAPRPLNHDSVRATLIHALATEDFWLARCSGSAWERLLQSDDVPSFDELRLRWSTTDTRWRDFFATLSNDDLSRQVQYAGTRSPREYTNPLWALLFQCANHSMQHRSEVALALTSMGYSCGDLDFIIYFTRLAERKE